jgi:hypothetical protein
MNKALLSLTAVLLLLAGCASSVTKDIKVDEHTILALNNG